jgi:hypothetical protein
VQRKLNYTGRKRIAPSDVDIELSPLGPGRHAFTTKLDLSRYRLPKRARTFLSKHTGTRRECALSSARSGCSFTRPRTCWS